MAVLITISIFLIRAIFNIYIYILIARFLLQWAGASYYEPISQFVVKMTNPLLKPLHKIMPKFKFIDLGILLLLLLFETLKIAILLVIASYSEALPLLPLLAILVLLKKFITFYLFAIILRAILSWIYPIPFQPLYLITEPILRPVRRLIPPIAGFDISPIIVMILLSILSFLLTSLLLITGRSLYFII